MAMAAWLEVAHSGSKLGSIYSCSIPAGYGTLTGALNVTGWNIDWFEYICSAAIDTIAVRLP